MNLSPALFRRTSSAWTGGPPRIPPGGRLAFRVVVVADLLLLLVAAPAPAMPMLAPISAQAAIAKSARRGAVIFISKASLLLVVETSIDAAAKPPVGPP